MLLALESVHVHRQFGGGFHVVEENEAPAVELGAVAEVHVLGEGVVLPAAGVGDAGFPPDAAGAIEGEEAAGAVAGGLFEFEVAVEEHRLDAGQHVEGAVQVAPARLDHADLLVGEIMDRFLEQVRIWHEVGVQNQEKLAFGETGAVFKRAGLVAGAVGAVDVFGIETAGFQSLDAGAADVHRFVGGVVQKLDLQLVLRVIHGGDRIQQAVHHVHFIEHRQLDGHQRHFLEQFLRLRVVPGVFQVKETRSPDDGSRSRRDRSKPEYRRRTKGVMSSP